MWLFVPLTRDEYDRLLRVATAERRRPQEQAAVLITQGLTALTAPASQQLSSVTEPVRRPANAAPPSQGRSTGSR